MNVNKGFAIEMEWCTFGISSTFMAICKLCKKDKQLIKKSHIIPEFMFKHSGLYDDKHRMRSFTIEDILNGKPPSLPQLGIYEGGLLCAECDNQRLGQNLEHYAKQAIYGGNSKLLANECPICINCTNDNGDLFAICENLSYTKYKLFLLSILWRASISSKPFFRDINIREHEEILRDMIYTNNAKKFYEYPIFVATTSSDKEFNHDLIIQPRQIISSDGIETCCFIIGSYIYLFKLGAYTENHDELKTQTISEENRITLLQTKTGTTLRLIKNYLGI